MLKSCIRAMMSAVVLSCLFCFYSCGNKDRNDIITAKAKEAHAQFSHACKLLYEGKQERAVIYYDSCYSKMEVTPYTRFLYYQFKSTYFYKKEDADNDLLYADSALAVLEKNKLDHVLYNEYLHALLEKGQSLATKENYKEAYGYFLKAKQVARETLDTCSQNEYSYMIAMTLYKEGKFKDAAYYFKDAFEKIAACQDDWAVYSRAQEILSNTGLSYSHCGMNDSSIYYYRSALSFLDRHKQAFPQKNNFDAARGVIYGNLGKVLINAGNPDSAEVFLKRSLDINEQPGNENRDALLVRASLAGLYLQKKDYPNTLNTLKVLEKKLDTLSTLESRREMNFLFSKYYEETGNHSNALPYYKAYIVYRDSMLDVKEKRLKTDIVREMSSREQKYEITLLKKDNQLNKVYLLVAAALAVIAIAIVVLIYFNNIKSRSQKAQLEKSNREKDRILNVVAHDLRSPIGGIAYLADMVLMEDDLPELVTEAFGNIKTTTESSLLLINELLAFSQDEKGNMQKELADICLIVKDAERLLMYRVKEKDQSLTVLLPGEPVFINVNKEKISRVLTNIITNAIKFSKNGSGIIITVTKRKSSVLLAVKDSGIGIPAMLLPGIFEMFTTSKRKGTGGERSYGLGLAICKQIVDAHNGKIWVETTEGAGSTFYIELFM